MNKKILIISIITLLIDRITKILASSFLKLNISKIIIKSFFSFTLCHNNGAAWGLFSKYPFLLIVVSLVAVILIYHFTYCFKTNTRNNIAFGLLYGGLFGNLTDRIIFGYVIDFLDFYIVKYDYPVFNVADMAIVIGVFLLIISSIKGDDKSEDTSKRNGRKTRQVSSK